MFCFFSFLPDDSKCDVVGVVARIFRYQRHPKEGGSIQQTLNTFAMSSDLIVSVLNVSYGWNEL